MDTDRPTIATGSVAPGPVTSVIDEVNPPPAHLRTQVGWNFVAQAAPLAATACLTPYVVHRIGIERYGLWALLVSAVGILTSIDLGVGQSLLRFIAMHRGRGDDAAAARVAMLATVLLAALAAIVALAFWWFGPLALDWTHTPESLRPSGSLVLKWAGAVAGLALLNGVPIALLQAYGRYRTLAAIGVGTQLVNALLVVALLERSASLNSLLVAAVSASFASLLVSLGATFVELKRLTLAGWRQDLRELVAYGWRVQMSGLTALVNLELDAIVVAVFLPIRYVGYYSIGASIASGLRNLPIWGLPPMFADLAQHMGSGGEAGVARRYRALQRQWVRLLSGYLGPALAASPFLVIAWMGRAAWPAAMVALILTAGNAVNLLTGVTTGAVRAIGKPGLETRYGVVVMLTNVVLTIPAAIVFGMYGVVLATCIGQVVGSLYFLRCIRIGTPLGKVATLAGSRPGAAVVSAGAVVLLELGVSTVPVHGVVGLALAGLPPLVAWIVYGAATGMGRLVRGPVS
jgi:O-antigen/teichoic acid export membrane protein